jgi:hypothetical protein
MFYAWLENGAHREIFLSLEYEYENRFEPKAAE